MKKIITKINILVFGIRAKGEKLPRPTVRTLHIQQRPSENEWLKEFKCSILHNKKAVYIN
jgi:hypothetical protein